MKYIILFTLFLLCSCTDSKQKESRPAPTFEINNAVRSGTYELPKNGITVFEALHELSGPAMCQSCFKTGGEEKLWVLTRKILIMRNGKTLRIPIDQIKNVNIEKNDIISPIHTPF